MRGLSNLDSVNINFIIILNYSNWNLATFYEALENSINLGESIEIYCSISEKEIFFYNRAEKIENF